MGEKTGLFLGKMAPFHGGHQYCLDTALDECDHVIVLVYYTDVMDVPLQERASWFKEMYYYEYTDAKSDGTTLDVVECWTGPDSHGYSENIKRKHEEYVLDVLSKNGYDTDEVDAFYSSERYGEHMSEALGAEDRRVDQDRETMSISATMIREEGAHKYRDMIPKNVYSDLIPRIAIVGGVSTGKSTLTRDLAKEYNTEYMPEYGEQFWEENEENGQLTQYELYELAYEHTEREDEKARDARNYLFVDTTPLTTMAWSKYYHGEVHDKLQMMAQYSSNVYDLHVLCSPDIPFESKPGRDGKKNRKRLHRMHKALMNQYNIDYITVSGSEMDRVNQVKDAIEERDLIPL